MKLGIKLWSTNPERILIARKHFDNGDFDYIELAAKVDSYDEKNLSSIKGIPVIIHCDNDGVSPAHPLGTRCKREHISFEDAFE